MYNYTFIIRKSLFVFSFSFILAFNAISQAPVDTTKKAVADTLRQQVQLSFVPYLSTNGIYSGKTINRFSLNILAGHSMGVDGFEVGGFANSVAANVKGFQAAGFANIVGKNITGFQAAGFVNLVGKNVKGFQGAGFANINGGTFQGFQASGFANINKSNTYGFQGAGFANINGDTTSGGMFAGYINIANRQTAGIMAAGAINYAHYINRGFQVAGLFNYVDTLQRGMQVAGLFNINSKSTTSAQVAGLFNYTKNLQGIQLAPFNFADTISKGLPIGFFSFVRTGVHQIELSFDELMFLNVGFRTGVRQFHNIFNAGIDVRGGENLMWTFGYGIGTTARLSNRLNFDLDITANHISKGQFDDAISQLNKLYLGLEFKATKNIKIAAGPVLNVYLTDTQSNSYSKYADIAPYTIFNHTYNNGYNLKGWIGGKVAIRFL